MEGNVGDEINRLLDAFVAWLPRLVGALVIFLIGWGVAVILRSAVTGMLLRLGLNRRLHESPADNIAHKITRDPARSIGRFVYWLVMIIAITIAIGALEIPVLTGIVAGVYGYVPNVLAAILILAIGIAGASITAAGLRRWMGDTPTGKILSTVLPILIIAVTGFAILEQLKIAPAIVITTYIAIIGSVALGFAIAFGIGGADAAGRIMDSAYDSSAKNLDQAKKDIEKGKERAREDAERAKRKAEE